MTGPTPTPSPWLAGSCSCSGADSQARTLDRVTIKHMAGIIWQLEHFTIKNKHTYNNKHYEVLNNYTTIIIPLLPRSISCSKKVLPLWYTSLESARTGGVNPEKYYYQYLCLSVCQYNVPVASMPVSGSEENTRPLPVLPCTNNSLPVSVTDYKDR